MIRRPYPQGPDWGHPSRADSASAEAVDAAHRREEDFRVLNQSFSDIESGFKNLKETVPPSSQDWWHERELRLEADLEVVRNQLNAICHDLAGLLAPQSAAIARRLADLKIELAKAQEGLGARTAAGQAKENS